MNKWIEILLGVILLGAVIYVWGLNVFGVGTAALEFFKGGIVWLLIFVGLILIVLGISDLRE